MRAYKFRSASQIAFALDIIINRRLFCADWKTLNDPMEGMFVYSRQSTDGYDYKEEVQQIIEEKKGLKVCSLSGTFDSHLLWAHYAGGFDGCAIEVEIPDNHPCVKRTEYRGVFAHVSMPNGHAPEELANQVLSSKYQEWSYEQEVRILQSQEWFQLEEPVKRVIAGHRMPPALFEAMNIICNSMGIRFCRTGIGDEGIDADYVEPSSVIAPNNQFNWDALKRAR
ncbi:hypothetical protein [Billgrantia ethanolica]|uniref:DUF2971 domain-containing protein n=1 Tax=Billgrantia ethanolica TaxID=2733486 RepID=A0ABS8ZZ42_9GAMM|nr:hypothetical protein [Halomonas ethanolica]MCE8001849.1 hypothetical protein [Halomonas ethanolica]